MEHILLVSADGHTIAQLETMRTYMEPEYLGWFEALERENERYTAAGRTLKAMSDDLLEVVDARDAIRSGGLFGAWDVKRRLAEMDAEGITAEVTHNGVFLQTSPFFGLQNDPYPADVRFAGARAYHRWVADCITESDGRIIGVADCGPCLEMDATVGEINWIAAHGFRSISAPGNVADPSLPPLTSDYYEPYWRACVENGLVVSVHAGYGHPQGRILGLLERLLVEQEHDGQDELVDDFISGGEKVSPFDLDYFPTQVMWSLMVGGVFDRYPDLQLALTEVRADWVPAALKVMDERYAQGDTPLRKPPSDYWRSNCWAGVSSIKQSEVRLRHEIGIDRMMFGRDYPHLEGTWPNTMDWLRDSMGDFSEDEARSVLGENAIRCYGLDRDKLAQVAERIGPRPSDILGGQEIDPAVRAHMYLRSGADKSYENIDRAAVAEVLQQTLDSAAAPPDAGSRKSEPVSRA